MALLRVKFNCPEVVFCPILARILYFLMDDCPGARCLLEGDDGGNGRLGRRVTWRISLEWTFDSGGSLTRVSPHYSHLTQETENLLWIFTFNGLLNSLWVPLAVCSHPNGWI